MIKIPITYKNLDDEEVTETLHFHLSMRELTEMEVRTEGGMYDKLQKLLKANKGGEILVVFQEIIGAAYGEREDNNPNSFLKSPQISARFLNSLAYDALFSKLVQEPDSMIKFINGLMPVELMQNPEVVKAVEAAQRGESADVNLPASDEGPALLTDKELQEDTGLKHPKDTKGNVVAWAYREPTDAEVRRMNRTQLLDITSRKSKGWTPKV